MVSLGVPPTCSQFPSSPCGSRPLLISHFWGRVPRSACRSRPSHVATLRVRVAMADAAAPRVVRLRPSPLNSDTFAPYGQLIDPSPDGSEYGSHDAQLQLPGIPRFYIMHLEKRSLSFDRITHHASVTQCLGSIGGVPWYIGVVEPSIVDNDNYSSSSGHVQRVAYGPSRAYKEVVHSKAGHYYIPPLPEDVKIFRVEGPRFLKLHVGTWHVGPLFKQSSMDFYNLELNNTNVVDHTTYAFKKVGVTFDIDD